MERQKKITRDLSILTYKYLYLILRYSKYFGETLSKTMDVLKLALLISAYGSIILIPMFKGAAFINIGTMSQ